MAALAAPTFTTEMQPLPLDEGFEEEVNTALDKVMSPALVPMPLSVLSP